MATEARILRQIELSILYNNLWGYQTAAYAVELYKIFSENVREGLGLLFSNHCRYHTENKGFGLGQMNRLCGEINYLNDTDLQLDLFPRGL